MELIKSVIRPYLAPLAVSFALIVIHLQPSLHSHLIVLQEGFLAQSWRLLTTHLVHLNSYHLLTNIFGLLLVAVIFRDYVYGRMMINVMIFSGLFAALFALSLGDQHVFVGFSGVLHGLVAYAGVMMLKHTQKLGFAVLALLVAKLVFDMMNAEAIDPWLNAQIAYLAHLGGALGGLIAVQTLRRRQPNSTR